MAAAKMDKEAFKKNQFWIVLGVFGLIWFIALIIVEVSGSDESKKKYETSFTGIKGAEGKAKTEAYLKPWIDHGTMFRNHKDTIWSQAWKDQESMYTWPESMPRALWPKYPDDPFGYNALGQKDQTLDTNNRDKYRNDWYREQFGDVRGRTGLAAYYSPVEFRGGFFGVFPMVDWKLEKTPTVEEIWLAQEDFWVRRELMDIVKKSIDAVAVCVEVPVADRAKTKDKPADKEKAKDAPAATAGRLFRNANWELNLILEKAKDGRSLVVSDKSTIKNIHRLERTQFLATPQSNRGLPFMFRQGQAEVVVNIAGEPLPFNQTTTFKREWSVSPVDLTKPFELRQVLDWEVSPVRIVETLTLGKHSHRTVTHGLSINEDLKKLDPEAVAEAGADAGAAGGGSAPPMQGGMPGTASMGGGGGEGGRGGPGGAAATDATRFNSIPRKRYAQVTPQCRHLPVGLCMVVDQAHLHDILGAAMNSRLRLQITQVAFHHVRDVQRLTPASGTGGTGGNTGTGLFTPGAGSGPRPGMGSAPPGVGGGRPMMGDPSSGGTAGGSFPAGMPGGGPVGGPAESSSQFKDNARLVELSIYGIAALYERFPPRPKPAEGQAGTPATPR